MTTLSCRSVGCLRSACGFRSAPGVLMVPLQEAFGWDRATISLAVSINLLLFGFMGPFSAALMERYGIRKVVASALTVIASGAALTLVIIVMRDRPADLGLQRFGATGNDAPPGPACEPDRRGVQEPEDRITFR